MAKIAFLNLSPADKELFWRGLQPGDRFTYSNIRVKTTQLSRYKIKNLSQRSLLPQISADWAQKTDSQKLDWKNAGAECNLNGWRLYVKDKSARIKNGLIGDATPSLLHQVWAGQIHIAAPAKQIKIAQLHPRNYYVYKKIIGTKAQYSPVLITEDIALPFTLGCNYKSNLSVVGPNPFAKLYATVWYKYQAVDLYFDVVCDLDFVSAWKTITSSVSDLKTILVGYSMFIEVNDLQGDLYFDKIKAEHSGQNWCRDPFMQDFNQSFTRNFYQIPKHWAAVIMPEGATYDSVY